jgi:hypothetical protein
MSDPRSARIAELKSQAAREKAMEQKQLAEAKMKEQLAKGVLKAVEKVEETLEEQIKALDEVENMGDEELEILRERRLRQAREQSKKTEQWRALGHGEYRTITEGKEFFQQAKTSERVVVHFGRTATKRCEIVDGHLTKLARTHLETKFIRVEAERCPNLAEKFNISVLPSIVLVKNNFTDRTLVGFEEFGGVDDFTTATLEKSLLKYGMVNSVIEEADDEKTRFGKHVKAIRKGDVGMDDWED